MEANCAVLVAILAKEGSFHLAQCFRDTDFAVHEKWHRSTGRGDRLHCTHTKRETKAGAQFSLPFSLRLQPTAWHCPPSQLSVSGTHSQIDTEVVLMATLNPTRWTVKITHYTCLSTLSSWAAARTPNGPKRGCRSCDVMLRKINMAGNSKSFSKQS